jgi:putative Holliday junction resolvase
MPEFILGVDFGQKRIGLALGQTMTQSARALSTVANNQQLWHELAAVIKEWQISQIVIGLPLDMDGEEQEITRQVKNFAKKLQQQFELPINYIDERLTSYEAERQFKTQRANQLAKAKHKSQIDAMAAQIILQSWLDQLETA